MDCNLKEPYFFLLVNGDLSKRYILAGKSKLYQFFN